MVGSGQQAAGSGQQTAVLVSFFDGIFVTEFIRGVYHCAEHLADLVVSGGNCLVMLWAYVPACQGKIKPNYGFCSFSISIR